MTTPNVPLVIYVLLDIAQLLDANSTRLKTAKMVNANHQTPRLSVKNARLKTNAKRSNVTLSTREMILLQNVKSMMSFVMTTRNAPLTLVMLQLENVYTLK